MRRPRNEGLGQCFVLNDRREVVPCPSILEWAEWLAHADRVVANTRVGSTEVSTVFIGAGGELFETALFFESADPRIVEHYWTWAKAEAGHARWVAEVEKARREGLQ